MEIYADLIFDAVNSEGNTRSFRILTKFRSREQMETISERYLFDDIIPEIEMILPREYVIDSSIEFGTVYDGTVPMYDLDLSWIEV